MNDTNNMSNDNNVTPVTDNNNVVAEPSNDSVIPVTDANNVSSKPNTDNVIPAADTNNVVTEPVVAAQSEPVQPMPTTPNMDQVQQPSTPVVDNTINTNTLEPNNQTVTPNQNMALNPEDEELLKAYIGNNYDKITTRKFNIAGFFFTTFYMFYRKMFLYAIVLFLVNFVVINYAKNFASIISILFSVVVGLLINKIYIADAKKKISKIKQANPQKSIEELKNLCANKGGVSVGKVVIGFFTEIGIIVIIVAVMFLMGVKSVVEEFLNLNNWNIEVSQDGGNNTNDTNNSNSSTDGTLLKNVEFNGYSCVGSKCSVTIKDPNGNSADYSINSDDELIKALNDYKEYINVDIYYTDDGSEKKINSYKIYLKANDEDISNVKTESALREKIGLYSLGTYTEDFVLKEIGTPGTGYDNGNSYTYNNYTFTNSKNTDYEMKYINAPDNLNLVVGSTYTITFEVVEGIMDYDYNIVSITNK